MGISFVNYQTGSAANASTVSCNKPSGVADDDILVAVIGNFNDKTYTNPSGWSTLVGVTDDPSMHVCWKKAASEGASWSWTASASAYHHMIVLAYRGCDLTNPINAYVSTAYSGDDANMRCHSVTTDAANCMVLALGCTYYDMGPCTAPSGYTERYDGAYDAIHLFAGEKLYASAGATEDQDIVLGDGYAGYKRGVHVALKPAAASSVTFKPRIILI